MTGDGLQDIVLLRSGNIAYWPNLGHGRWGAPVHDAPARRGCPTGYDPRRLLLGDVDGDGVADLVYVDHGRVLLWGNQSGNAWTAAAGHRDRHPRRGRHRRRAARRPARHRDGRAAVQPRPPTAPAAPRCGSSTSPAASSRYLLERDGQPPRRPHHRRLRALDAVLPARRGRPRRPGGGPRCRSRCTSSPGSRCTTQISGGRLTTEYRYHHGYWDGVEREFRGFAMVEQLDTETFDASDGGPGRAPFAADADQEPGSIPGRSPPSRPATGPSST